MNPIEPSNPSEELSSVVVLSGKDLKELNRFNLGFPDDSKALIKRVILTPQVAVVWIHLGAISEATKPSSFYPALRQLARIIDEDCKQMSVVIPVVIALQVPTNVDVSKWAQIDTDTDLNAGEFVVRLPTESSSDSTIFQAVAADDPAMEAFIEELQCQHFEPYKLSEAIRPRNEDDYRDALLETETGHRSPLHDELLTSLIQPNWNNPKELNQRLIEYIESFSNPTTFNPSSNA